jgi:predicted acetyltransferase
VPGLALGWGNVTKMEIRPLTADDDLDAQRDLGERAFGAMPPAVRDGWLRRNALTAAAGRYLAVFDGSRQVGGAAFFDMRQWWAGRELPMAGVASVKMAPEARGQGTGRRLMTELLREIAERGYPLSALYPATMPIYRSLGWELAGGRYQATIPTRSLRDLVPPDAAVPGRSLPVLRKATVADAAGVISVLGRAHQAARDCGPVTRDLASVEDWLAHGEEYRYLGDDAFLAYEWQRGNTGLFAGWLAAASPEGTRALWSLLAAHSSTADTVEVRTSPDNPVWLLLRERDARLVKLSKWMLRVVDAKAAIAGRGFPDGVSLAVRLTIIDDCLPRNSGRWDLVIDGGQGRLERAATGSTAPGSTAPGSGSGTGTLTLGARGLAALYGGTPVATLRLAGLAAGGSPAGDAALSAAFSGLAFMLDDF